MNDSSGRPQPLDFEKPIAELEGELGDMREKARSQEIDLSTEIAALEAKLAEVRNSIYENLTPWQRVQIARHVNRPFMLDYLNEAFDDFCELHGDRLVGDDQAMPGGFALLDGRRCVVIGHQKGRNTKENLERNFGSAHPEGYRKALRLMKLAEKFRIPVVSLIDTPGAFPGIGAEERNIAEAIARNLREMMNLRTPIVVAVVGEGGSGGALGVGVADRILMLENAYYSVISPEGCAAILWKHRKHAPEAAEAMKLTAEDLAGMSLIDEVVPEPRGGAHHDVRSATGNLKTALISHIDELADLSEEEMLNARYEKFRQAGQWAE
ncbi:MAG: acetyl-CoA carboxylase carboxyltransferase subunit alpha [Roseibacillus sp.]|nr:acetyl-CoA carboxylase carboxyltransferase subunit alpha [Roseibacillus sp.]MDP7106162.1 acetyl-CoA carboxylase carboxyltransferase subunit alpha [Roseibacillus sp.]MDP7657264.1 acetyl-CoA carboxylase carboxyltransferase subunit alpha [Roseibacillus sp.]HJM63444.1 acetyl-CoA carboxylase carboxyltransferase subunit alpha [Roseibacillus sp.]